MVDLGMWSKCWKVRGELVGNAKALSMSYPSTFQHGPQDCPHGIAGILFTRFFHFIPAAFIFGFVPSVTSALGRLQAQLTIGN